MNIIAPQTNPASYLAGLVPWSVKHSLVGGAHAVCGDLVRRAIAITDFSRGSVK
jgi:hypothetical protein